jgi:hypothetical protein
MIAIRHTLPTAATGHALAGIGTRCGFDMQSRGNAPVPGARLAT